MDFEVLKQISEYFYIDFKDITDGIKTKNENINNKELYGEYLYNNLKGIIRKIVVNGEYLEFEIKV